MPSSIEQDFDLEVKRLVNTGNVFRLDNMVSPSGLNHILKHIFKV